MFHGMRRHPNHVLRNHTLLSARKSESLRIKFRTCRVHKPLFMPPWTGLKRGETDNGCTNVTHAIASSQPYCAIKTWLSFMHMMKYASNHLYHGSLPKTGHRHDLTTAFSLQLLPVWWFSDKIMVIGELLVWTRGVACTSTSKSPSIYYVLTSVSTVQNMFMLRTRKNANPIRFPSELLLRLMPSFES
ncbi:uncharacterized protein BDR25DRAFT_353272 [Lindgomyces ingoldianus]|uniref:Uncharacterized protein n=1 Tax=Lindgomyces ingoldianus TaxID=673940 RepID=A0ACB6R147_9PLEO|nr:uncharacterized protein BDR25DRAFT_353272 [Lindgomyces ingoldianus]KAF2472964.1 hypothetical protein BDR25DRAFT_353272 [Lindgomyces ingoldianus]